MISDEFPSLSSCYGRNRLCFNSFGELVHCYEDVCESTFSFLEWTYMIQPPGRERPGDRYGLELMG
jgi:hypothetical protein